MIDLLIVDDSEVARKLLNYIFSTDPQIRVIGAVKSGEEALKFISHRKPHVITMDVEMPNMDGFEVTRQIMGSNLIPIVIITATYSSSMVDKAFSAVDAGALAILEKPSGINHPDFANMAAEILNTVKIMSEVKVVRRTLKTVSTPAIIRSSPSLMVKDVTRKTELIAIGASTGGPQALEAIFSELPKNFSIPIVLVQHIAVGFIKGFIEWLNIKSGPVLVEARNGELLLPGHIYVAPNGFHMGITTARTVSLKPRSEKESFCPSVSYLFNSVATVLGKNAAGVLLTGMGNDGAAELKLMRNRGAMTIVQDEASSIVYGMPAEAVKLDGADYILPPKEIGKLIAGLRAVY